MSITLRDYQEQAVAAIRAAFALGIRAVLFVLPTGGGKSIVLGYIAYHAALKGNRVIIYAHRIELVRQLSEALDKVGCAHGIIAAGYKECLSESVQIASVDTYVRRVAKNPQRYKFDFQVTDEGHHLTKHNKWGRAIDAHPNSKILIVTASPQRLSGEGLGSHADGYADRLILGPTIPELVAKGALVPIKVFAPPLVDMTGVKIHHGEYDRAESAKRADKPTITGSAIEHYKKLCSGKRAIVFCASVAHSQHVADEFNACGVSARHVDANTPTEDREAAMKDFRAGRILVLTNVDLFGEGIDVGAVFAIIMLQKTASLTRYMQMVGRAMRPSPDKTFGILLDHCSNCVEHGWPDEVREWSLDGKKKGKKKDADDAAERMRLCQVCFGMNPVWRQNCEQCNAPFEARRAPPKQVDGELKEVTDEQKEQMRLARKNEVRGARDRASLEEIARQRGYKKVWIDFTLKAREQSRNKNKFRMEL